MSSRYQLHEIDAFLARIYGTRQLSVVPYSYNTIFTALAPATTQSNVINIAANGDFLFLALSYRTQIGAAQTEANYSVPFVRLMIIDSGSNEQFYSQSIDLTTVGQSIENAAALPYPRMIGGRSALTVQATNFAPVAETYSTLEIVMHGCLVRVLSE